MSLSVSDLRSFYKTRLGRITRRILSIYIAKIWPSCAGLRVMGCGYATPYLHPYGTNYEAECERIFALMPLELGVHHWPQNKPDRDAHNRAALIDQTHMPIETNSIDRIIMVHNLELADHPHGMLAECYRVLKSSGRMLVIVPNRSGFWARNDKTPFGQGRPYSIGQLKSLLEDTKFIHENTQEALFMSPAIFLPFLKVAQFLERFGQRILPIVAGVHVVEVSKQIYARNDRGTTATAKSRPRRAIMTQAAKNSQVMDE